MSFSVMFIILCKHWADSVFIRMECEKQKHFWYAKIDVNNLLFSYSYIFFILSQPECCLFEQNLVCIFKLRSIVELKLEKRIIKRW